MRRRALLVPFLILAHLAVLVVALLPSVAAPPPAPLRAIAVSAVASPPIPAEQPLPLPPTELAVATSVDAPQVDVALDSAAPAVVDGCALTADIETALRDSGATRTALARVPAGSRSVANALMLWDGRWAAPVTVGGAAALEPLQQIVVATIRAAPAGCRTATVTGPRLLFIPDGTGSTVLAFGSGIWSWEQLLS